MLTGIGIENRINFFSSAVEFLIVTNELLIFKVAITVRQGMLPVLVCRKA